MATKFFEHCVYIGGAMKKMGGRNYQLWDDEDGFFYDVLRYPDRRLHKFEVRSLVGLIPLYAIDMIDEEDVSGPPDFLADVKWSIRNRSDLVGQACISAEVQLLCHTGYEPDENDHHDVRILVERFSLDQEIISNVARIFVTLSRT